MADFDIGSTASSVMGIAGMGIGLGILAHTARNVSDITWNNQRRPTYQRSMYGQRNKMPYHPRAMQRMKPFGRPTFQLKRQYW